MPKTRVAVAVRPLPVPRSLAGKSSGEMAYKTPYMICRVLWVSLTVWSTRGRDTHVTVERIPIEPMINHRVSVWS